MAEKLNPEQRKKVAEACGLIYGGGWSQSNLSTLVQKTAQLGQAAKEPIYSMAKTQLMAALATGNTDDLELLCHELLEAQ